MDVVALATIGGGAAAVVGTGLVLGRVIGRPLRRLLRQNELFREEWWGREAEPMLNRPRTPSVPERLACIESELQPNSGGSTRDAVDRIERALQRHINDPHAHRGVAP